MNILPAIDLRHGRVVQLVGGDPDNVAVQAENTPGQQAVAWKEAGATMLHVVDLDGALGDNRQWHVLDGLRQIGLPIQFGGGVRSMVDVQRLTELGVDRVIVGTQGVKNPEWLVELANLFPGRVVLAIDAFGRDIAIEGWQEKTGLDVVELARQLRDVPLAALLYTNVEKEGRMEGIDDAIVRDLRDATDTPLIVSGGIHNMDDLKRLSEMGVESVVLGMSIYTGVIDLAAAIKEFA